MIESTTSVPATTITSVTITIADLRAAGLKPRQIHRLQVLRDCLRCYPQIEFFANDQWKQLLFLRWRYDRGEFADDMPPVTVALHDGVPALPPPVDLPDSN